MLITPGLVLLREVAFVTGLSRSLTSTSRSDDPEPLRLGLMGTNLGDASLDDNFGVKECERVWTWEGGLFDMEFSSMAGADIDIDTVGSVELRGGEADLTLGNG